MKRLVVLTTIAALAAAPLAAHPLKDVDQQVALTVAPDHVDMAITIVPSYVSGADIFDMIDRDQDGTVSDTEASEFANDVLKTAILTDGSTAQAWDQITASVPDRDTMTAGGWPDHHCGQHGCKTDQGDACSVRHQLYLDFT